MAQSVEWKIQGPRADIVFNRPDVLNAADADWVEDLHAALGEMESAYGLRAVVLSGKGRAFSTGIDLKALSERRIQIGWFRRWEQAMRRIELLQPVTIARIHGYALGGGLQVALACDLRIAAEGTRLGLPAVVEGLIPGLGTYRLPRFVGLGRARRLVLTGEVVEAAEARDMGLVDWVFPQAALDYKVDEIVRQVSKTSRTAQYLSKRLLMRSFEKEFEEFCELYLEYQSQALASADHEAAMTEYRRNRVK